MVTSTVFRWPKGSWWESVRSPPPCCAVGTLRHSARQDWVQEDCKSNLRWTSKATGHFTYLFLLINTKGPFVFTEAWRVRKKPGLSGISPEYKTKYIYNII